MNIVKFDSASALPAYLSDASFADINKEVVSQRAFPTLSIKGMKFTVVKDGIKKVLTKPDDEDEVAQSIGVVFLRANLHAKTFYSKKYSEADSDGARPDCYSYDGQAPSENAANPQSKKCAVCPHNQWGSRVGDGDREGGKGKACQDNARIAVSAPDSIDPMMLRVPPASLKNLREALKIVAARKVPYNAALFKIGFDREAPSPLLTFKPVGLMDDKGYAAVKEHYDGEVVRAIVGLDDLASDSAPTAPKPEADELDAAIAAKAKAKAAAKPAPEPEDEDEAPPPKAKAPKATAKPKVDEGDDDVMPAPKAAKPKAEPKAEKSGAANLLADLDDLLGSTDD